jgi:hypothetical protein
MTKPIGLEALLNLTFFGLDTISMLGDIEDFINFSENNIDWQKRRELRCAESECAKEQFDDPRDAAQFHAQTIDGVTYRFEVSLAQRVRYAALVSLITTIEWVLISLKNRATFDIPEKPNGKSEAMHFLDTFNQAASVGLTSEIQTIETLVQIRNCIVHAAGLLASYKYGNELRQNISACHGVKVSDINLLGESVEIEQGYLQCVVEGIKRWLPNLEMVMDEKGLLRK